jgi:hypothetical protein
MFISKDGNMNFFRTISSAAIAGAVFVLAGCGSSGSKSISPVPSEFQTAPAQQLEPASGDPRRKPDSMDASVGTVDALARKTQAYSREMEPLVAKRSSPPAQPSSVEWMEPGDLRLTDHPTEPNPAPVPVHPVIQTSPTQANQVASTVQPNSHAVQAAANVPAAVELSGGTPAQANPLAEKFARRVRENPRDISGHLEYQLVQFLLDEQVPQLAMLAALPSEDREMLTAVLDGLAMFRNTLRSDNNMLLSRKIRPLLEMSDRLRSQAELTIPAIALCSSVEGFGKYHPIEPARFAAGSDHRAVIYCEIANFCSNLGDGHQWETRLKQDMTLYTEGGIAVWSDKSETIEDSARVRRQDFFVNKRVTIPANLTIGRYLLKVTVVDLQANRVAEATVPIAIVAK